MEDRALGAILGCALGDALGLPAEGHERHILEQRWPDGLNLPHPSPTRDFPLNDWTDDTDQTVLVLRALAATNGDAAHGDGLARDFARRLVRWFDHGFSELGDTAGSGCGGMTWRVLRRPDFTTDPAAAARAIIGPKAGNGALMRTAPCAFAADPAGATRLLCLATHSDPRCVASCLVQVDLVRACATESNLRAEMLVDALMAARRGLSAAHGAELIDWAHRSRDLDALRLDERDARGYTFKTLGCAMWAFRALLRRRPGDDPADFFRRCLREIVMRGGDADTNAAVAGALLGAALGAAALPPDWLAAPPHVAWLRRECREGFARLKLNRTVRDE